MTHMTSPSDQTQRHSEQQSTGVMNQASDAVEKAGTLAADLGEAVKERPYTTMAVAGGLAFAVGALWMIRRNQPRSRYEAMWSHLPNLPDRRALSSGNWTDLLPKGWDRYWR